MPTGRTSRFNYNKKAKPAALAERAVAPRDRARVVNNPPNTAYVVRAITTDDQSRMVGAVYHPLGNLSGFERAPMAPLDTNGRNHIRRARHREAVRHATHPPPFEHRQNPTEWP